MSSTTGAQVVLFNSPRTPWIYEKSGTSPSPPIHSPKSDCQFAEFSSLLWIIEQRRPWNPQVYGIISAILAIAFWLSSDVMIQAYLTFRKHNGLYYWSIVLCACGVVLEEIGWTFYDFKPEGLFTNGCPAWMLFCFYITGTCAMVTGFSLVLYSRLHLVTRSQRLLRIVLSVIVLHAVISLLPLIISGVMSIRGFPAGTKLITLAADHLSNVGTLLQEALLAGTYVYTVKATMVEDFFQKKRKARYTTIAAQVLVLLLDIPMIVIGWTDFKSNGAAAMVYGPCQPLLYAIKLKIEIAVLDQLVALTRQENQTGRSFTALPPVHLGEELGTELETLDPARVRTRSSISAFQSGRPIIRAAFRKKVSSVPTDKSPASATALAGQKLGISKSVTPYGQEFHPVQGVCC